MIFGAQITAAGVALAILIMNGCAQPPTRQLEEAQKAVEAARAAEAETYVKDDFIRLEQEFAVAKDELAKQEKALSLFRSYDNADAILIKVVEDGGRVAAQASQNKEAAKTAALAMEQEAQYVVVTAKELMAKAPTGKERAAVEAIKQDLNGLETGLGKAHQLVDQKAYIEAMMQARAVKEKGGAVVEELQRAIEKTKEKKPVARG
jgi:hypothetical protein